jgi:hypothetical protein
VDSCCRGHTGFQALIATAAVLSLLFGCGSSERRHDSSQLSGWKDTAATIFSLPLPREASVVRDFSRSIVKESLPRGTGPLTSNASGDARDLVQKAYLHAISDVGGIPREQGETVLKDLVSENSRACAGVSCSKIFGLGEEDVEGFFDFSLLIVGANAQLAKPEKHAQRATLIGSLLPKGAVTARPQSTKDLISRIYLQSPLPYPVGARTPDVLVTKPVSRNENGKQFNRLVAEFTNFSFEKIRRVETTPRDQLIASGMSSAEINSWHTKATMINNGLKKLPRVHQTVYRGVRDVQREHVARFVALWLDRKPLALGPNDLPALTSTSWRPEVASLFLIDRNLRSKRKNLFDILFVIDDHQGVGIENLSVLRGEAEVLLPTNSWFMIENIIPVENENATIIIKLKGVKSAAQNHRASVRSLKRAA